MTGKTETMVFLTTRAREIVGHKLRSFRKGIGESAREVCEHGYLRLEANALYKIESGTYRKFISSEVLGRLLGYYAVVISDLFDDSLSGLEDIKETDSVSILNADYFSSCEESRKEFRQTQGTYCEPSLDSFAKVGTIEECEQTMLSPILPNLKQPRTKKSGFEQFKALAMRVKKKRKSVCKDRGFCDEESESDGLPLDQVPSILSALNNSIETKLEGIGKELAFRFIDFDNIYKMLAILLSVVKIPEGNEKLVEEIKVRGFYFTKPNKE